MVRVKSLPPIGFIRLLQHAFGTHVSDQAYLDVKVLKRIFGDARGEIAGWQHHHVVSSLFSCMLSEFDNFFGGLGASPNNQGYILKPVFI